MSLDVYLTQPPCSHCGRGPTELFHANVTHNLRHMAEALGVYGVCWRPDEHGITKARQLTPPLSEALTLLVLDPESYRKYEDVNGWGDIKWMEGFLRKYRDACIAHPDADVEVSR